VLCPRSDNLWYQLKSWVDAKTLQTKQLCERESVSSRHHLRNASRWGTRKRIRRQPCWDVGQIEERRKRISAVYVVAALLCRQIIGVDSVLWGVSQSLNQLPRISHLFPWSRAKSWGSGLSMLPGLARQSPEGRVIRREEARDPCLCTGRTKLRCCLLLKQRTQRKKSRERKPWRALNC
jgi:hypothetical protein